jgi:sterol 14-demethylase
LTGEQQRKLFFEHRGLDFNSGYSALLGGSPPGDRDHEFGAYFRTRLLAMLKGPVLKAGLPQMIRDVRNSLDTMAAEPSGRTDPFETIYRIVFQLTMRAVACNEIADDPKDLATALHCFETIDKTGTPLTVMFPWLPLPAKFQRLKVGAQLYMMFQRVIEKRKKEDVKSQDALQFLLDQGDDTKGIITVSTNSLRAVRAVAISWGVRTEAAGISETMIPWIMTDACFTN